jgi:hypothetical protein
MIKQSPDVKMTILFNLILFSGLLSHFLFKPSNGCSGITVAYLDPGTGSMIISAIIGVFATIALGVKTFWYKIVHIFKPASKQSGQNSKSNHTGPS